MILPYIGLVYVFMGKYDRALEAYQTAYQLSLASHNERWRVSSVFGLVYIFSILNRDMDLASKYLQEVPPDSSLIFKLFKSNLFSFRFCVSYSAEIHNSKKFQLPHELRESRHEAFSCYQAGKSYFIFNFVNLCIS